MWAVLADTAAYPLWNPHMLVRGGVIEDVKTNGDGRMVFRPRLLAVRPGRELRRLEHVMLPGLLDAEDGFFLR